MCVTKTMNLPILDILTKLASFQKKNRFALFHHPSPFLDLSNKDYFFLLPFVFLIALRLSFFLIFCCLFSLADSLTAFLFAFMAALFSFFGLCYLFWCHGYLYVGCIAILILILIVVIVVITVIIINVRGGFHVHIRGNFD